MGILRSPASAKNQDYSYKSRPQVPKKISGGTAVDWPGAAADEITAA